MSGTTAWVQESSMARRGGLEMADGGQLGADPRLGAGGLHYIYKWEYARVASLEWNVEQFGYPGSRLVAMHRLSVCRLKRRCASSWSR